MIHMHSADSLTSAALQNNVAVLYEKPDRALPTIPAMVAFRSSLRLPHFPLHVQFSGSRAYHDWSYRYERHGRITGADLEYAPACALSTVITDSKPLE
jgi:hypothetical protein